MQIDPNNVRLFESFYYVANDTTEGQRRLIASPLSPCFTGEAEARSAQARLKPHYPRCYIFEMTRRA